MWAKRQDKLKTGLSRKEEEYEMVNLGKWAQTDFIEEKNEA